jgi:hypothetical protein
MAFSDLFSSLHILFQQDAAVNDKDVGKMDTQ